MKTVYRYLRGSSQRAALLQQGTQTFCFSVQQCNLVDEEKSPVLQDQLRWALRALQQILLSESPFQTPLMHFTFYSGKKR